MWPPEALAFLRELEANNDRDWFKSNRSRYDNYLVAPARRFADSVRHLGEAHFFRPYRDTRFRPGPPLKEQFGAQLDGKTASEMVRQALAQKARPAGC